MSYIGQRPVVGRYIKLDQISSGFNGSETSFSMTAGSQAVFPGTARNLLLSLGGVIQEPDTNFTISGSTLTFTTAPVANTTFFAVIFGDMQSTGTPSDGTVLPASIASSGNFSFPQLTVTGTSSLGDDVTFTGANYNVVWDKSADALEFPDGAKAVFGTGSDVEIYHDGTNSRIHSSSHNLYIRTGGIFGVFNGAGSETMLKATVDGAVELYHNNSKKFETTSTGVDILGSDTTGSNLNGDLVINNAAGTRYAVFDASHTKLNFSDNALITLGTSNDLQIYHDGSNSYIKDDGTGAVILQTNKLEIKNTAAGEDLAKFTQNAAAELYYDNSKKFETTTGGVKVTGSAQFTGNIFGNDNFKFISGASSDLQIYHSGTQSFILNNTGNLILSNMDPDADNDIILRARQNEPSIVCKNDGAVELYHNNSKKFETTSTGVAITGGLTASGSSTFNEDVFFIGASSKTITFDQSEGHIRYLDNAKAQFGTQGDLNIYHDGSHSYIQEDGTGHLKILGSTIQLGKTDNSELGLTFTGDGSIQLRYDNSTKFETTSGGVDVTGSLSVTNHITLPDQASGVGKLKLGDGVDFQLYHNGSHSVIENRTGNLIFYATSTGEVAAKFIPNGAVELYYDNSKKFETTSLGTQITGRLNVSGNFEQNDDVKANWGNSHDLQIYHDSSATANILLANSGSINIRMNSSENAIVARQNGAVELYYDNSKHFQTTSDGVEVDGELMIDPDAGGTLKFTGLAAHHSKMIIGDNGGTANGNFLIEGGDGTDFLQIASNGDIDIAEAIGQTINSKVAIQHGGINPRGLFVLSSSTSYQSITMQSACSRNTTNESYRHFQCSINGVADKMRVYDNGNIENTNNSYGSLSDETLKENIVDAGSQWNDIKNIRVRKFNFKSLTDPDQKTMLGVVAQEAELVCPNLVTTKVSLQEGVEKEYKSFKYSVLYMKAIKCLQEAMAKIEVLETEVAALKAS